MWEDQAAGTERADRALVNGHAGEHPGPGDRANRC